jgi:hypothetical protein
MQWELSFWQSIQLLLLEDLFAPHSRIDDGSLLLLAMVNPDVMRKETQGQRSGHPQAEKDALHPCGVEMSFF